MRKVYVSPSVIDKVRSLRRRLWLSLLPLSPCLLIVLLNESPDEFLKLTGLSYWSAFGICGLFLLAGIFFTYFIWRCPVCQKSLGGNLQSNFCPHCATFTRVPQNAQVEFTDDETLYRGSAFVTKEELVLIQEEETNTRRRKRYTSQMVVFTSISVLVALLAAFSEYNFQKSIQATQIDWLLLVGMFVLYAAGIFFFCWNAAWFFFLDERLLRYSSSRWMKAIVAVYNFDIIKLIIVFLVGGFVFVLTFGLLGVYEFYRAYTFLRYPQFATPASAV